MSTDIWTDIKTVLGVPSFIGGLYAFYLWMRKIAFRPKIVLLVEDGSSISNRRDPKKGQDHWWIHVTVLNDSMIGIESCRAFLKQIYKHVSAKATESRLTTAIPLCWENLPATQMLPLGPGERARLDLAQVSGTVLVLTRDDEGRMANFLEGAGTYDFYVSVAGGDAKQQTIIVKVEFIPGQAPKVTKVTN